MTSLKPKSGSLTALRKEALTAVRSCDVKATLRALYSVTSERASVYVRRATAIAAAVPTGSGEGQGWTGTRNGMPARA